MAFARVFNTFPGNDVLNEIESVDAIDAPPPNLPLGTSTGAVLLVGEFERGDLNRPIELLSSNDQATTFGGLGFPTSFSAHDGAVARKSGGAENWNGNGFVWLRNKRWRRLIVTRVDNSAGSVQFSRLACLTGGAGPFSAATGDSVSFLIDGTTTVTPTVTGTKGIKTGASGTFTGLDGLTIEIKVDAETSLVTTFTSADTTLTDVINRINATHAQTIAFDNTSELELRSIIAGGLGRIEIVGGTAVATLGFPAIVNQVDTYTVNLVSAGTYTLRTNILVQGVSTDFDATYVAAGTESVTELRDALLLVLQNSGVPGVTFASSGAADITATGDDNITFTSSVQAEPTVGDVTIANTTVGVTRAGFGTGNVLNLASFTATEAAAVVDAVAGLSGAVDADGNLRVCATTTPATGTLQATAGTLLPILGFDTATIADANDGEDVTIPAGTRVQGSSPDTIWVTLEDIETGSGGGSFDAKVRPFDDTNTALANTSGTVTTIVDDLPDGFSVTNSAAITRLSGAQLDTRYQTALDATLGSSSAAKVASFVCSARSSDAINRSLLANAESATAAGLTPRKAIVRPLLGTSIADATGTTGQGVGAQRSDRRQYCFPGVSTRIPEIASVGTRGGTGFTVDGIIQTGSDSFLASVRTILNPEENAGQALAETNVGTLQILALEDIYNPDKGGTDLQIGSYKTFKSSGITAPIIDEIDGPQFQSDVTSVDPTTSANLAPANRRVMADFLLKSLVDISKPFIKKLGTPKRRQALLNQYNLFLSTLKSIDNPDTQRILDFLVEDVTTDVQYASGILFVSFQIQLIAAIETIAFRLEAGQTVTIEEAA